ncbi:uracil-DNA glycosylase [Heliobacterium chlorum]|uniref:Type-4 uracil-DNA glycosylase n=1 Tax=Heliobacterium chlorum TaxID=2698 RepID=A0ABR7SYQ2_HELCL|nr:uracil-DNA glycosylase [Heliobacterium chlorum]MBC9783659.1 uracil-DNA glycosylase [Heliobacterium chlorum]
MEIGGVLVSRQRELADYESLTKECRACPLREGCNQVVFGEGNPEARLMLVGEGPGADEDRLGSPFVGAAGQLLNKILDAGRFPRNEVYICNVVKCRPPSNRLPLPNEVKACLPHLERQIELINPEIIICLGALATQVLVDPKARITRDRGKWVRKEGRLIMPTFHPAALLRDPSKKRPVWEDIQKVMAVYHAEWK